MERVTQSFDVDFLSPSFTWLLCRVGDYTVALAMCVPTTVPPLSPSASKRRIAVVTAIVSLLLLLALFVTGTLSLSLSQSSPL